MRDLALSRDAKVLEAIRKFKYIRTDQIADLLFKTIKNEKQRQNKAAERLRSLYKAKAIQRMRFPSEPYIWYIKGSRYSTKMMHYLTIVDVYLEIALRAKNLTLEYEVESQQGNLVTDLIIYLKNDFRAQSKKYFIEVHLDSSENILSKITKYEDYFLDHDIEDALIIICKHQRDIQRIHQTKFEIAVKAIDLQRIREQWVW